MRTAQCARTRALRRWRCRFRPTCWTFGRSPPRSSSCQVRSHGHQLSTAAATPAANLPGSVLRDNSTGREAASTPILVISLLSQPGAMAFPAPDIPLQTCAGGLLKEAVDDLEWAAAGGHQSARGNVHLLIRSHPRAVTMRASGAGALEVGLTFQGLGVQKLGCPGGLTTDTCMPARLGVLIRSGSTQPGDGRCCFSCCHCCQRQDSLVRGALTASGP
jgi:hypothetical protein